MADTKYKLTLTGEQIDARLQLIDGDASSVRINANTITTNNSTLVTQADLATESNDGLMTKELVKKLNSIDEGANKITIIASPDDPGENSTLTSGTLYFVY